MIDSAERFSDPQIFPESFFPPPKKYFFIFFHQKKMKIEKKKCTKHVTPADRAIGPSAARNSDVIINSDAFDFPGENHGKQLQIVIFDHFEISRFAIVSRDFQSENQKRRSL